MKEVLRERRAFLLLDVLLRDIRHAFRRLGKEKGFTASAALTLALGIGAGAAVFAALDAVVLRPLPYAAPDRLVAFSPVERQGAPRPALLSYPNFFDFRRQNRVFERLACYRDSRFNLTDSLPAIQVGGEIVSWDLFPLLGVKPELGRGFLPEEEEAGTHVVVLGHSLWMSRFGGDRNIPGRSVRINGRPFTVVGVAPEGFQFPMDLPDVQLWVTLAEDFAVSDQRGGRTLDAVGRLKPGVSVGQARAQMEQVAGALARQYPEANRNYSGARVIPELERVAGSSRRALWILLGAVAMLLAIACANVANLLLARGTERSHEFALRLALGAPRRALMRQLLVESLALGFVGTVGGIVLAWSALKGFLPLAAEGIPRLSQATVDGRVLAFSAAVAVLTTIVFGLAPAVEALRADAVGALKAGASTIAPGRHRFRSALVVGQMTLGLVLLAGAELLITGFLQVTRRDPGFRTDHLLSFNVGLAEARYDAARMVSFCDRLIECLGAIPVVEAAAAGRPLPLTGHEMRAAFDIEERRVEAPDRPRSDFAIVTPGYFAAMGVPLLQGRDFSSRDDAGTPLVLVVNRTFARRYFPGEDVIGKRIQSGAGPRVMREIVGVVGDARQAPVGTDPDPICYFPYRQLSWGIGTIVLRTAVPPREVESAARDALAGLDREAAMHQVRTGEELSSEVASAMRFQMLLMATFAAVALFLTASGLYGVLSYAVAMRRREIGVRIALGAGRPEVLGLVLREAAMLVAAGLVLGSGGAFAAGRIVGVMISGMQSGTTTLIAGACGLMVMTSLAAACVPAARAASVDPTEALRSE